MDKFVYLLGAGSSANTLPLVKDIPGKLSELINFIKEPSNMLEREIFTDSQTPKFKTKREYQQELYHDLNWLHEGSRNHTSVDTFAKKLFIRSQPELKKFKIGLSLFFIYEQVRRGRDIRYDAFFASILNDSSKLPDFIQIISWNYDYQLEFAYSEYSGQPDMSVNQSMLNVNSKNMVRKGTGFSVYKLNGTTSFLDAENSLIPQRKHFYEELIGVPLNKQFVEKITSLYALATHSNSMRPELSFSWELEDPRHSVVEMAAQYMAAADSIILIVIGYSFPFFNREVDRKIIRNMKIKKIYFQDKMPNNIRQRFKSIRNDIPDSNIEVTDNTEQFLLPNEL